MIAFSFWTLHIYWYGIFYALAFIFGYIFFLFLRKHLSFFAFVPGFQRLLTKWFDDIFIFVIIGLLLWGRMWHIFIYDLMYYIYHPLHIFAFWEWGMSFIWGIIGVISALFFLTRKYKFSLKDFFVLTDCLLVPVVFGITIGRIGNFLNQELYGIIVPSGFWNMGYVFFSLLCDFNIFHVYSHVDQSLRVNTNFLSSFFEGFSLLVLFGGMIISFFRKKIWSIGLISSLFLVLYSWIRFFLEYLRADSQLEYVWWFTKSQRFFLFFFVLWLFLLIFRKRMTK